MNFHSFAAFADCVTSMKGNLREFRSKSVKVLIVRAHPNTESFGQAIAATYIEGASASAARHEIREVNLATADFDPVLRYGYQKHM